MGPAEDPRGVMVTGYDEEAEATGWFGPEVAFGLAYAHVHHGQSILDIGIGTGLGSALFKKAGLQVHGMDISPEMLEACRKKGFDARKCDRQFSKMRADNEETAVCGLCLYTCPHGRK